MRGGPSHIYSKAASTARKICDHLCKKTFATKSAKSGQMHRSKMYLYSITSSASSKNDSRTDRPSALAVLRFTTSSNLTGDCAAKLAGSSPLRMRSTYEAERRKISAVSGP